MMPCLLTDCIGWVHLKSFNEPSEAVHGASAVFTDTWISMGQESEAEARKKIFHGYQVTQELMAKVTDRSTMSCYVVELQVV